ncbi:ABC transporter permease [Allorhizocola rhizosphaerae]|uniref:ABC transporter permease n=1 Tax=Allorhizocola rhizosphaerae TaxID=1872709 RepID=UPI000E3E8EEA|nr:ABC transporter permease [Allorhizocola rhizosphaerae]
MNRLRIVVVGGYLAYKGLFHWLTRRLIFPTLVLNPTLQVITFTVIGAYLGSQPAEFYAVGNSVHAMARASIFAATVVIAAERTNGTLSTVLATPAHPLLIFGGRLLPALTTGFFSSVLMLGLSMVIARARIPLASVPGILLMIVLIALACSALGLCLGALALYLRDVFFLPNVAIYATMLLCGVNLTTQETPAVMRGIAEILPLTHGLRAIRSLAAGTGLPVAEPLLELAVAAAWALAAAVLLRVFSMKARAHATLDLGS